MLTGNEHLEEEKQQKHEVQMCVGVCEHNSAVMNVLLKLIK